MSQELNQDCAICLSLGDICVSCEERAVPVPPAGAEIGVLIDHLDDYIARINGDDRGSDATVNELRAHFTRLEAENAALQQRLNVADQRVDDLATERSPKDFAIEHAEYLSTTADSVGEHFNAYGLALMALEEADEDSDSDELLDILDFARSELQESLSRLRNMTYEFRKRRDRATQ